MMSIGRSSNGKEALVDERMMWRSSKSTSKRRTVEIAFAPHDSDRGEAELVRQRVPEPDPELQA